MTSRKKNSLVANINKRRKAGKSRSKRSSHVSAEAYKEMRTGWPHSAKAKRARKARKKTNAGKASSRKTTSRKTSSRKKR